jgi:hypothetical protein
MRLHTRLSRLQPAHETQRIDLSLTHTHNRRLYGLFIANAPRTTLKHSGLRPLHRADTTGRGKSQSVFRLAARENHYFSDNFSSLSSENCNY